MRYALCFALSIVGLTAAALATFDHISITAAPPRRSTRSRQPIGRHAADARRGDSAVADRRRLRALRGVRRDLARYVCAAVHGGRAARSRRRTRTCARFCAGSRIQIRAIGPATARDRRARAVGSVASRPTTSCCCRWRGCLSEEGRSDDAIGRYRQILALAPRGVVTCAIRARWHGVLCLLVGVLVAPRAVVRNVRRGVRRRIARPRRARRPFAPSWPRCCCNRRSTPMRRANIARCCLATRRTSSTGSGLARALAWGGKPRDAERELRALQARHLQIRDGRFAAAIRARRDGSESRRKRRRGSPSARRTRRIEWRSRGHSCVSISLVSRQSQYDTLLMGASLGPTPEPLVLRREQAHAYLDAGDAVTGAARLRDVLRLTPRDTAIRHELAVVLAGGRSDG